MSPHSFSLRSLFLLGLCAWLSLHIGKSATQAAGTAQTKTAPPIAHFTDMATKAGFTAPVVFGGENTKKYIIETTGTGVAIFDYDNDGWPDIFIVNGTKLEGFAPGKAPRSHLYHNNHDGTFTDVTEKAGLTHTGWGQGVCVGDYDNDGFEDLYVTYYGKNVLYRNNGNGGFTDVSEKAGVAGNGKNWGTGCAFVDYDRDGKLDLIVANYVDYDSATALAPGERPSCMWKGVPVMCGPRGLPWAKNILYHNLGNGTFEDVTKKANIDKTNGHYAFSVSTLDYDDDGWPDIFVACDSTASILYHNNHDGTFTDIAVAAGCAYSENGHEQAGMGVAVADYDCDGWFDIFKTNFSDDTCNLYHNNGDGSFTDVTFPSGIGVNNRYVAWGCGFADFDNDGWPDIMQINGHVYPEIDQQHTTETFKNPRLLYKNLGNGRFEDVSTQMGPGISQQFSSRGAAFGDYDNDGDIDALILNLNDPPSLLRNDGGNKQNWIKIKLIGTQCNRTAIGARVRVVTGKHAQMNEVHSGSSVMSQSDLRLHFGLGKAATVDMIEVKWPTTQKIEKFMQVKVNQILTIREGSGIVKNISNK